MESCGGAAQIITVVGLPKPRCSRMSACRRFLPQASSFGLRKYTYSGPNNKHAYHTRSCTAKEILALAPSPSLTTATPGCKERHRCVSE